VHTTIGFVQGFLTLSLLITLAKLSTDSGGGDYFFTLMGFVIAATLAPYAAAMAVMRRVAPRLARAVGFATILYGTLDGAVRTQAFFFPTDRSGGAMAVWLPVYALALIPLFTSIVYTASGALGWESPPANEGRD
jgi:hypothetical protein